MKKYIFRLSYLFFLIYVLGAIVDTVRILTYHLEPKEKERVLFDIWNPWEWISDFAHLVKSGIIAHNLVAIPIFTFVGWLIYRWMKKPTILVAGLLLVSFFLLNPHLAPFVNLFLALTGQRPWIQSIF